MLRLASLLSVLIVAGCEAATPSGRYAGEPMLEHPSACDGECGGQACNGACGGGSAPAMPEPSEGGRQEFGAPLDEGIPHVALNDILAEPTRFEGQVLRTDGEVARVCQRMGCWMELRGSADGPGVRVPMAGHSFFLPRDAAGRHATMVGRVALRELSAAARAHLESEGATLTASALSIEASSVVLD